MTLEQAIKIRTNQLKGEPIPALVLQEAIRVLQESQPRKGRPYKFKLPALSKDDRDRMNGLLMFNLGRLAGQRAQA